MTAHEPGFREKYEWARTEGKLIHPNTSAEAIERMWAAAHAAPQEWTAAAECATCSVGGCDEPPCWHLCMKHSSAGHACAPAEGEALPQWAVDAAHRHNCECERWIDLPKLLRILGEEFARRGEAGV